jgi:hypothetical protein
MLSKTDGLTVDSFAVSDRSTFRYKSRKKIPCSLVLLFAWYLYRYERIALSQSKRPKPFYPLLIEQCHPFSCMQRATGQSYLTVQELQKRQWSDVEQIFKTSCLREFESDSSLIFSTASLSIVSTATSSCLLSFSPRKPVRLVVRVNDILLCSHTFCIP